MTRKLTRLKRSMDILKDSKVSQWCYVNTENEFEFMGDSLKISKEVGEYKVHRKAGEVEDYTNESIMEEILVVLGSDGNLKFYNQNYDYIEPKHITARNE